MLIMSNTLIFMTQQSQTPDTHRRSITYTQAGSPSMSSQCMCVLQRMLGGVNKDVLSVRRSEIVDV